MQHLIGDIQPPGANEMPIPGVENSPISALRRCILLAECECMACLLGMRDYSHGVVWATVLSSNEEAQDAASANS